MTEAFARVIRTYGQEMACYDGDGQWLGSGMAILQPMAEADWQYTAGALGSYSNQRFLGLAEPQLPAVSCGGWVIWDGSRYEVMTVRPIWVDGVTTHLWMALRPAEEAGL